MFRASDIFGRKAGAATKSPTVPVKEEDGAQKRPLSSVGPAARVWDPATGEYRNEDLPLEVQQMMGIAPKKIKTEVKTEDVWGTGPTRGPARTLGPSSVGLAAVKGDKRVPISKDISTEAPSVEYSGFNKVDLNDRYYEKSDLPIHGRPTYWTADAQFFVYWQGEVARWSICDAASLPTVRAGQYPGWAYKEDHKHLCTASGWMEAWNGAWQEPSVEVTYRSFSSNPPQWDEPALQKAVSIVEFHGFSMKELNTRFFLKDSEQIQGRPSYWDKSGVFFVYWQQPMNRWAICDLKCLPAVKEGQCPGWAYRKDAKHFANACGWMERRANEWTDAKVETAVVAICTKGLKVEFSGFTKQELNTKYTERPEEEVQGRTTFWDPSDTYFIYWQESMQRWAICDRISLPQAKNGLAPGWAYRTDSAHFTRSRGWMEVWGREWKNATVTCVILEGNVQDAHHAAVKAELKEEEGKGPVVPTEQYHALIKRVYEERNPSKLPELGKLLKKYKNREHELYTNVCEKYEVDADEFLAQGPALAATYAKADAQSAKGEKGEAAADAEVPHLSTKAYAVLIQSIYEQHNPEKLRDLALLLQKYRHQERELYQEVCKKYGVHPAKFHASKASALQEQLRVKPEQ